MATLKGELLGSIKGKIGRVVARRMNGKTVISVRPPTYKKTKSKKAKYVRSRFAIAVEFSRYVNSIELLKKVWKYNFKKCSSAFNMIERYNIKRVGDKAPSLDNIITPESCKGRNECRYFLDELYFNGEEISVSFENIGEMISLYGEADYYAMFVILYHEPKAKKNEYFIMDHVEYQLDASAPGDKLLVNLTASQRHKAALYKKAIIYSAAVVRESVKDRLYSSVSFAKEFELIPPKSSP